MAKGTNRRPFPSSGDSVRGPWPRPARVAQVFALAAALLAGATSPGVAQLRYSGGLSFSRGSYFFDEATGSFYWGNRVSLQRSRLELSVSLPLIVQQEGAVTWVAGAPLPTGGTHHGLVSGRGSGATIGTGKGRQQPSIATDSLVVIDQGYSASAGDPLFGLSAELYSGFGFLRSLRIDGRVKAPITDLGEGSGTGEWDYTGGASLTVGVGGALAFLDASYWWIGDLPELELLNSLSYAAGVSIPVFDYRGSVLLGVSGSSKTIPTADVPVSINASAGMAAGERGFLSLGISAGLTETAPDFTVQAGWSVGLSDLRR